MRQLARFDERIKSQGFYPAFRLQSALLRQMEKRPWLYQKLFPAVFGAGIYYAAAGIACSAFGIRRLLAESIKIAVLKGNEKNR